MKTANNFLKRVITKLNKNRFAVKDICTNSANPKPNYKDVSWEKIAITNDQLRIESELKKLDLENKRILHIGVGSSSIAKKFLNQTTQVDGITIMPKEKKYAESLNLPNYNVYILNKYSDELNNLPHHYDFIIDNNLSSFACCKHHYFLMINNYVKMLNEKGMILTDKMGMNYCEDYAFGIEFEDLQALESLHPLKTFKLTNSVFAMQKL